MEPKVRARVRKSRQQEAAGAADAGLMKIEWSEGEIRFDLRAADSFQLAAALEWCEDAPQGRVFLTADQKLGEAALLSGFDAKQM